MYFCCYDFAPPVGRLYIAEDSMGLSRISSTRQDIPAHFSMRPTTLTDRAAEQLKEFFSGQRKSFDLPLSPQGTLFQRRVWTSLLGIPYGATISYKSLAILSGCPRGSRAVGHANHVNPLPFIIPCHRVIASNGSLGGYVFGPELKLWLLTLEKSNFVFPP